jgi:hypothetical protein
MQAEFLRTKALAVCVKSGRDVLYRFAVCGPHFDLVQQGANLLFPHALAPFIGLRQ